MKNKKELVCMLGMRETGKDYNAQHFVGMGYKKICFADSLREMLWKILGWKPDKNFNYADFKKSYFSAEKGIKLLKFIPFLKFVAITTGRRMLQNLGSVIKEYFGETIWADLWGKEVIKQDRNVVCTDVRFIYEAEKALSLTRKGYTVKFIWCCYENANFDEILKDTHESEMLNQHIYYNQDKYNLEDGSEISHKVIKQIIKDFKEIYGNLY